MNFPSIPVLLGLLVLIPLQGQDGVRPPLSLSLISRTVGLSAEGVNAEVMPEENLRRRLEGVATLAGYRISNAAETAADPSGVRVWVHGANLSLPGGGRGFDLSVMAQASAPSPDVNSAPLQAGRSRSKLAPGNRFAPDEGLLEAQRQLAAVLEELAHRRPKRVGVDPTGSAPIPPAVAPKGGTGGILGGSTGIVEVRFTDLKVKVQPPAPPYPKLAREAGVEGLVVIELTIDSQGVPVEASCLAGPEGLRVHAEVFALAWRFMPPALDGKHAWARFQMKVPYSLTP